MKIAVVGLGMMGTLYVKALCNHRLVREVVGVEEDKKRAEDVAHEFGIEVVSPDEDWSVRTDATFVCLPDDQHVEIATSELRAGKYVFVEKPLATTTADSQLILDAQIEVGKLMVGHILRFDERLRELRRKIASGAFGKIYYIRIHRANTTKTLERVGQRVSVSAFLGVHDLDLLLWLTGGEIESVQARGRRVSGAYWDVVAANLFLKDGSLAVVQNHWLINKGSSRSGFAGVEIYAENGSALVDLSTSEIELIMEKELKSRMVDTRNWTHDSGVTGGALRRQVDSFLDAIETNSLVEVSGEEGYRAVRAVELIETALKTESIVRL